GWESNVWHWYSPKPLSRDGFEYVRRLPQGDLTDGQRSAHFVPFMAHADATVARDACKELEHVSISDVAAAVQEPTHTQLKQQLLQEAIPPERRGYFAKLIGLIGDNDDRRLLHDLALKDATD